MSNEVKILPSQVMIEEYFARGRRSVIYNGEIGMFERIAERPIFHKDEVDDLSGSRFGCYKDVWEPLPRIKTPISKELLESYLNEELGFYPDLGTFVPVRLIKR